MFVAKTKNWVALMALVGAMAMCVPALAQTGGLTGDCKDDKGEAMAGYPVLIERTDVKGVYKAKTDKKGHYIYIGLPLGMYKVTLQSQSGQEIFHFGGVHVGIGDPQVVNFDMAKERAATQKQQEANPEYQKQVEQQKKETEKFTGLKAAFDQGNQLYNDKKYAEAAAAFEQALPLASGKNQVAVLGRLADSYAGAKQYDKAVENFQKVIALDPTNAQFHSGLGNVYANTGKIPEAMDEFKKSADLDPPNASKSYFNLGVVLYNTGKMDEAAEAFKKSTDLDPKFADAYALRGRALMGKVTLGPDGKTVIAPPGTVEALEAYLKLDPNGRYAEEAKGDLQAIQGGVQTEYKVDKKKKKG